MNVCPGCGRSIGTEDQRFCRGCGAQLGTPVNGAAHQSPSTTPGSGSRFPSAVVAPFVVAFCLVLLVVLASVPLQGTFQSVGPVWGAEPSGQNSAAPSMQASPAREPQPTPSPEPTQTRDLSSAQDVDELMSHIPDNIAATCTEQTDADEFGAGLVAAVSCRPPGSPGPDTIAYLQYESPADMQAIYSHITDTIAPGLPQDAGCGSHGGRGSWSRNRVPTGTYVCYDTVSSGVRIWWTVDELAIITLATDQEMSVNQIWEWFVETNTGPT